MKSPIFKTSQKQERSIDLECCCDEEFALAEIKASKEEFERGEAEVLVSLADL